MPHDDGEEPHINFVISARAGVEGWPCVSAWMLYVANRDNCQQIMSIHLHRGWLWESPCKGYISVSLGVDRMIYANPIPPLSSVQLALAWLACVAH